MEGGDGKHRGEGGDGFHPPVGVIALLLSTAGDVVLPVHVRFLRPSMDAPRAGLSAWLSRPRAGQAGHRTSLSDCITRPRALERTFSPGISLWLPVEEVTSSPRR